MKSNKGVIRSLPWLLIVSSVLYIGFLLAMKGLPLPLWYGAPALGLYSLCLAYYDLKLLPPFALRYWADYAMVALHGVFAGMVALVWWWQLPIWLTTAGSLLFCGFSLALLLTSEERPKSAPVCLPKQQDYFRLGHHLDLEVLHQALVKQGRTFSSKGMLSALEILSDLNDRLRKRKQTIATEFNQGVLSRLAIWPDIVSGHLQLIKAQKDFVADVLYRFLDAKKVASAPDQYLQSIEEKMFARLQSILPDQYPLCLSVVADALPLEVDFFLSKSMARLCDEGYPRSDMIRAYSRFGDGSLQLLQHWQSAFDRWPQVNLNVTTCSAFLLAISDSADFDVEQAQSWLVWLSESYLYEPDCRAWRHFADYLHKGDWREAQRAMRAWHETLAQMPKSQQMLFKELYFISPSLTQQMSQSYADNPAFKRVAHLIPTGDAKIAEVLYRQVLNAPATSLLGKVMDLQADWGNNSYLFHGFSKLFTGYFQQSSVEVITQRIDVLSELLRLSAQKGCFCFLVLCWHESVLEDLSEGQLRRLCDSLRNDQMKDFFQPLFEVVKVKWPVARAQQQAYVQRLCELSQIGWAHIPGQGCEPAVLDNQPKAERFAFAVRASQPETKLADAAFAALSIGPPHQARVQTPVYFTWQGAYTRYAMYENPDVELLLAGCNHLLDRQNRHQVFQAVICPEVYARFYEFLSHQPRYLALYRYGHYTLCHLSYDEEGKLIHVDHIDSLGPRGKQRLYQDAPQGDTYGQENAENIALFGEFHRNHYQSNLSEGIVYADRQLISQSNGVDCGAHTVLNLLLHHYLHTSPNDRHEPGNAALLCLFWAKRWVLADFDKPIEDVCVSLQKTRLTINRLLNDPLLFLKDTSIGQFGFFDNLLSDSACWHAFRHCMSAEHYWRNTTFADMMNKYRQFFRRSDQFLQHLPEGMRTDLLNMLECLYIADPQKTLHRMQNCPTDLSAVLFGLSAWRHRPVVSLDDWQQLAQQWRDNDDCNVLLSWYWVKRGLIADGETSMPWNAFYRSNRDFVADYPELAVQIRRCRWPLMETLFVSEPEKMLHVMRREAESLSHFLTMVFAQHDSQVYTYDAQGLLHDWRRSRSVEEWFFWYWLNKAVRPNETVAPEERAGQMLQLAGDQERALRQGKLDAIFNALQKNRQNFIVKAKVQLACFWSRIVPGPDLAVRGHMMMNHEHDVPFVQVYGGFKVVHGGENQYVFSVAYSHWFVDKGNGFSLLDDRYQLLVAGQAEGGSGNSVRAGQSTQVKKLFIWHSNRSVIPKSLRIEHVVGGGLQLTI